MPTYDYQCKACGHQFELFQQMSAPVMRKCPRCGKPKLERLIGTGAGVLFKGGGFYETDYRSDSYKKAAEAETKSTASKGDKTESKSETPKKAESTSGASDSAAAGAAESKVASPKKSKRSRRA
jgi:putative FmdB family regulatory protein